MDNVFSAKEINEEICKLHGLEEFNCLAALFGWGYQNNVTYAITITAQKIQGLRDFEAEFFELYVKHSRMIYEYFWDKGFRDNDLIYIVA